MVSSIFILPRTYPVELLLQEPGTKKLCSTKQADGIVIKMYLFAKTGWWFLILLTIVWPFDIGTLASQKKREKLFWECIFAVLNLKRKINIEGQHVYCFSHIGDSRCYTAKEKLN